ncbi:MAG: methionyl-tRNA formyltransferase [Planctomycetaceae bacterium]
MSLRLLMMGTGTFALPTFRELLDSGHEVVGLVTQPDRLGRGHHHHLHPMKEQAIVAGIPAFQPDNVNSPESLDELRRFRADVFVVAAYGQILSAELLAIPPLGAINLHASLLPRYRGAAPIQYAVWKGEAETGVTIFRIEPKLDAGPILGVVRTPIGEQETSGELELRLADLAAPVTLTVLDQLEHGTTQPLTQERTAVTRARKLRKEQGEIDWHRTPREIDCHLRAMQPWPMPYTFLHVHGKPPQRVLVLAVAASESLPPSCATVGTVMSTDHQQIHVAVGGGALRIERIQPAGKRAMSASDFLRGNTVPVGSRFGSESHR